MLLSKLSRRSFHLKKLMRYNKFMDTNRNLKILLIDDDKFLLEMYRKKFESDGAEVDVALGSNEAMIKLREGASPDVILLDIIMPGMDGLELMSTVKKEGLAPKASIIMLTNESGDDKVEKAKSMGAKGYIVKATKVPTEVVEEVYKIIGKKQ